METFARQQQQYTDRRAADGTDSGFLSHAQAFVTECGRFGTSVADHAHGWRREDEDASAEERQFPKDHDLLSEEADELGHAAGRMSDLLQTQTLPVTTKLSVS